MVAVFTILKKSYLSTQNILNIFVSCSIVGLVTIGETYLMIAGQIDMAAGSFAAFSGVLVSVLLKAGFFVFTVICFYTQYSICFEICQGFLYGAISSA